MFKKLIATIAAMVFVAQPTLAQDRTFVTNPPATTGSGISYNSGTDTVTATNADGARIYSTTRPIERGAKYRYTLKVEDYVSGGVQPYVGTIRDNYVGPTILADVPGSASLTDPGATPIPDNFTFGLGLTSVPVPPVQADVETEASFRLFCGSGEIKPDDPMVVYGMQGASHLHNFFGNTSTNAFSTNESLRTSGGSTCGTDQAHPYNRTAYWFPAMKDGRGNAIATIGVNVYYKREGNEATACAGGPSVRIGICSQIPHGLGFIWGYNMTTMEPNVAAARWECRTPVGGGEFSGIGTGVSAGGVTFDNLADLRAAGGCAIGNNIVVSSSAPTCWDGIHLRVPGHRSHMSYPVLGKCPSSHPYYLIKLSHQIGWKVDANFATWRLDSDDQMGMGAPAGSTFHTDVMFAWSPAFKTRWYQGCINERRSCSNGEDGQGLAITGNAIVAQTKSRLIPIGRLGQGFIRRKNGTFTGEFTAPATGEFGLNFLLFTGVVKDFKVTKIMNSGGGPVTQPVTQ